MWVKSRLSSGQVRSKAGTCLSCHLDLDTNPHSGLSPSEGTVYKELKKVIQNFV